MAPDVIETTKQSMDRSPLLPVRHPAEDFFICDILDAVPKDDMASMEHPIFSLSTKPDTDLREYKHRDTTVKIIPSAIGLATIHDKDILIYAISQLIAGMKAGQQPRRTLHIRAYDLLVSTNRETSGDGYRRLNEAFERLRGTSVVTNIKTNDEEMTNGFGLIESWQVIRQAKSGRMSEIQLTLSTWLFNVVVGCEVLTLHRDYFRLRKPLERRMYEIARKHCGKQGKWAIGLELLQKKCGSNSPYRVFRSMIRKVVEHDKHHQHFPDYIIRLEDDQVVFWNRRSMTKQTDMPLFAAAMLDPETYHDARLVAPGWDIHSLEEEWRAWMTEPPRNPDAAFIGFCRKVFERRGEP